MRHKFIKISLLIAGLFFSTVLASKNWPHPPGEPDTWGFFAHKRINRLAVLTLPPEMMVFFKPRIDWVADHATDPDMRRYASPHEAPRHYIDLDQYGPPFDGLPRRRLDALLLFTEVCVRTPAGDTLVLSGAEHPLPDTLQNRYRDFFFQHILPRYYTDDNSLPLDSVRWLATDDAQPIESAFFRDRLSEHGVLPWHLQKMQKDLTDAFRARNSARILKLCADMGHYIADGHVPLHTTSNYNGQKTGQDGIHGFWESRIPELFADEQYDYLVGKPEYLDNTTDFFWEMTLASNSMVDSVLGFERDLRKSFPTNRQMCPDMRNGLMVVTPCRDFAGAYQTALNGMIERRMRAAIHAVGSVWYTAWVDAGQPDLSRMDEPLQNVAEQQEDAQLQQIYQQGKILGRPEEH